MDLERVLPELRRPMKLAQLSAPRWLTRTTTRMMPVPRSPAVRVRSVRAGSVRLRVYAPAAGRSGAALLWMHGGGMQFGDARQDESLCLSTASRLGVVIVSANYRFAPEHPFPAAHDDVRTGWLWLLDHTAQLGVDPDRIVIGGESAGGGLAAGLVQRLHDDGGTQPCGQWLFAPMLDDRPAARHDLDAANHFVWNNRQNREAWTAYLGAPPGGAGVSSYAAPARRVDFTGLPPAYIAWGDIELFAAEDRAYAEALEAAGVPVTTDVVAGAPHGLENWGKNTEPAKRLIERAQAWLQHTTAAA
ncbi:MULTISPECIES: alpha/beta hydrolase [unclassified Microbacterium]|uniref:alpha/beta hydrolase n=1 Tax=unclassified Microbacterium TaxID=2609290 RepID=UPI00214B2DE6|nr:MULTISPECIES: alpha/beta hydrolase [unclassified Microbacterium]MCR2783099.1 alpha/beta hydrolase [Microbacterium sp. zg.B96]MDL5352117.1 alpha/beta hydrolase [Microbacterium sp. zg-YB36]WIM16017.1 alpha/beta hydrolase [Microbacterium sp. zg-B96]